jgi:hypothetical protein
MAGGVAPRRPGGGWAAAVGLAVLVVVTASSRLYLDNLEGLVGERRWPGLLTALGLGVAAGMAAWGLTRWVARRSRLGLVVLVVLWCATGWVLVPRPIDVAESFVSQPNARWSCAGWSFDHYPPGASDADTTTYCVGLEVPIADG